MKPEKDNFVFIKFIAGMLLNLKTLGTNILTSLTYATVFGVLVLEVIQEGTGLKDCVEASILLLISAAFVVLSIFLSVRLFQQVRTEEEISTKTLIFCIVLRILSWLFFKFS